MKTFKFYIEHTESFKTIVTTRADTFEEARDKIKMSILKRPLDKRKNTYEGSVTIIESIPNKQSVESLFSIDHDIDLDVILVDELSEAQKKYLKLIT